MVEKQVGAFSFSLTAFRWTRQNLTQGLRTVVRRRGSSGSGRYILATQVIHHTWKAFGAQFGTIFRPLPSNVTD